MAQVDIQRLTRSLNLHLPPFILRSLELLLHQRGLNNALARNGHLRGAAFVDATLDFFGIGMRIRGEEHLRGLRRPVLVSNHPLGGLDGLVLGSLLARHFGEVRLMVNDFLMNITQLEELFVPVSKIGSNRQHLQSYRELFSGEAAILHFPAGLCSRRKGGRLRDLPWNRSYLRLCRNTERPIVPCFFAGENSRFFYTVANLRRWFRIGLNIEMLFLVNEMFRKRGTILEAHIGKPIPPSRLRGSSPPEPPNPQPGLRPGQPVTRRQPANNPGACALLLKLLADQIVGENLIIKRVGDPHRDTV